MILVKLLLLDARLQEEGRRVAGGPGGGPGAGGRGQGRAWLAVAQRPSADREQGGRLRDPA